jgi:hypothetical protein
MLSSKHTVSSQSFTRSSAQRSETPPMPHGHLAIKSAEIFQNISKSVKRF